MSDKNVFEEAARLKYRFSSLRGDLRVEDLYDLPLLATGRNEGFDLDAVARAVSRELKEVSDESFVNPKSSDVRVTLENKLEVVKAVIAGKQAEGEKTRLAAERSAKRRKILDALDAQENRDLSAASREDLLKKLSELDS